MVPSYRWTFCILLVGTTIFVGFAAVSHAGTVAYYRFEEGFPDAIDEETGDRHGVLVGGVAKSTDVPIESVNGAPNNFSASFSGDAKALMDGSTFILHDEAAGGSVEATLEFYINAAEQGHNAIFWTIDAGGDTNRYNIAINPGGQIGFDYRETTGTVHSFDNFPLSAVDTWTHVAVTRTLNEDGIAHDYEFFVDGVQVGFETDPNPLPPTAMTWTISGRRGCCTSGQFLIDEIRFSDEALDPADFLPLPVLTDPEICDNNVDDDGDGDIDCDDPQCLPVCNDESPAAGNCRDGEDNDGDDKPDCLDPDCARDDACREICDDDQDNDGDRDIDCDDLDCATDKLCGGEGAVETWYRFEEGAGIDVIESLSDQIAGFHDAEYSTDVPLGTVSGAANEFSLKFSGGTAARMNLFPFILHSPTVGGAGDATLEWFMKARSQSHNSLFWTIDAPGDTNRYNIHMQAAGLGADFREEDGTHHGVMDGMVVLPFDTWQHLAVVRTDLADGTHLYEWYLEGVLKSSQVASARVPTSQTWTISGRSGCCNAFEGFVDEIHMVPAARTPDQFFSPVIPSLVDEDCRNQIDDDDDGQVDCDDTECEVHRACCEPDCPDQIYYRFEEGRGTKIVDEVSGDTHGTAESVVYSQNVPMPTVAGNENAFSLEFPEAAAAVRFNGTPFILHSSTAGGSSDATLEFYINAADQIHAGFFWTQDGGGDQNRYNIHINPGGKIQADYREAAGALHSGLGGVVIPTNTWVHVAIVRCDLGDDTHEYSWYLEHELVNTQFDVDAKPPTAETWTISGRPGCCNAFKGFIDEVRMTPEMLDPEDFLDAVSETRETVCDDEIDNDDDGATDCDDDDCATAQPCVEHCGDGVDNDGDGDVDCNDAECAGSILCECDPNPFPQMYYRFEEDLADTISGDVHGTTDAEFSDDVPVTEILGKPNNSSLSLFGGTAARFDGATFILHSGCEATLEWFMKPAPQGHVGVFWTLDAPWQAGDRNRYNIHFQDEGLGADYREEIGTLHGVLNGTIPLPFDEWSHIACVRTFAPEGGHQYDWYVDGELMDTAIDATPNPPTATTWTISGRQGCCDALDGLIDEVRMTPRALEPNEFLTREDVVNGLGPFIRGDCDGNALVGGSPTEAIVLLNFAFRGGPAPPCLAACDAEANGSIGVTDALRILRHAFLGQGEPDPPFPDCTVTDIASDFELGCETPIVCP